MKIFCFCASPRPLPFPGALCIRSFGFDPKATLRNRPLHLRVPSPFPPQVSPGGTASNFIGVVTTLAAHSGTPVVNVKGPTGHSIVIFVVPEETPESPLRSEEPISLLVPQPCPRPIQPHLPTPVKVNNLLLFLSGYDNSIAEYLATGFTMGFPLHYEGPQFSCHSKNLLSAMQNPTAVDAKLSKELGLRS